MVITKDKIIKLRDELKKHFNQLNDRKDDSIRIDTIHWEIDSEFRKFLESEESE